MNIIVLTNSIAGLHSFRKEVIKAIVDAGYIVFLAFPDKDERAEYFYSIGCKYVDIPFERRGINPVKDLKLMLNYRKAISQINPIAVLTYTIKPNVYGGMACAFCGVPLIANVTGLGDAVENSGLLRTLTIILYKLGLRKAHTIFFQNDSNRKFCVNLNIVSEDKAILLPGSGVNITHHTYQEYPDDGVIKFLMIGRIKRDKGSREYFEMAKVIKKKYPQTEFQVLGDIEGDFQKLLDEMVNDGVINYLGKTSDVRPYIGQVHCTVLPSYHEGLSNVNLESAANGRPVITTRVPGCKETVEHNLTGLICDERSTNSLIDAVEKFINLSFEEKKQMGVAGRKKVEREYNRQVIVNAYLEQIKILSKSIH